uniref:Myb-like domain-containing protein n=1 Tax=Timema poppense TaxID=170557 RepID=A0A7R9CWT5_TIMPO|nr:unnamed protein product [Timema poppensis]
MGDGQELTCFKSAMFLLATIVVDNNLAHEYVRTSKCLNQLIKMFKDLLISIASHNLEEANKNLCHTWSMLCTTLRLSVNPCITSANQLLAADIIPQAIDFLNLWNNRTNRSKSLTDCVDEMLSVLGNILIDNKQNQNSFEAFNGLHTVIRTLELCSRPSITEENQEFQFKLVCLLDAAISKNLTNCQVAGSLSAIVLLLNLLRRFQNQLQHKQACLVTLSHLIEDCNKNQNHFILEGGMMIVGLATTGLMHFPMIKDACTILLHSATLQGSSDEQLHQTPTDEKYTQESDSFHPAWSQLQTESLSQNNLQQNTPVVINNCNLENSGPGINNLSSESEETTSIVDDEILSICEDSNECEISSNPMEQFCLHNSMTETNAINSIGQNNLGYSILAPFTSIGNIWRNLFSKNKTDSFSKCQANYYEKQTLGNISSTEEIVIQKNNLMALNLDLQSKKLDEDKNLKDLNLNLENANISEEVINEEENSITFKNVIGMDIEKQHSKELIDGLENLIILKNEINVEENSIDFDLFEEMVEQKENSQKLNYDIEKQRPMKNVITCNEEDDSIEFDLLDRLNFGIENVNILENVTNEENSKLDVFTEMFDKNEIHLDKLNHFQNENTELINLSDLYSPVKEVNQDNNLKESNLYGGLKKTAQLTKQEGNNECDYFQTDSNLSVYIDQQSIATQTTPRLKKQTKKLNAVNCKKPKLSTFNTCEITRKSTCQTSCSNDKRELSNYCETYTETVLEYTSFTKVPISTQMNKVVPAKKHDDDSHLYQPLTSKKKWIELRLTQKRNHAETIVRNGWRPNPAGRLVLIRSFSTEEVNNLSTGVHMYGKDFKMILKTLPFHPKRTPKELAIKWKTISKG